VGLCPGAPPSGDLRGRCVALAGVQRLPRALRVPVARVLERLLATLWRGKRFEGDAGVNLWLLPRTPLEFARLAVVHGGSRAGITRSGSTTRCSSTHDRSGQSGRSSAHSLPGSTWAAWTT
jgi:hypothetical protein